MRHASNLATLLAMLAALGSAYALPAHAQGQQSRMAECNRQSAGKTGPDRQAFMSSCLSKPAAPRERMKYCNQQAAGKSGPARREYMSQCLSNRS